MSTPVHVEPEAEPHGAVNRGRKMLTTWRATIFAPVGDGQRRRRGSDVVRLLLGTVALVLCWLATVAGSSAEHSIAVDLASVPLGARWVVTTVWWLGSFGLILVIIALFLTIRRWSVMRDLVVAGVGAWLVCLVTDLLVGTNGGRPAGSAPHGFDVSFPVARVAATVAVALAAAPYFSRWVQRSIQLVVVLLAVAAVMQRSGLPVAVAGAVAAGWAVTAAVHLAFGSPLGLPSSDEVSALLADLGLRARSVERTPLQELGVARFVAEIDGSVADVSFCGRDSADTQLLSKAVRFALYRDSGPSLTLTRWQQVEHEAYVMLMASQTGARVPDVVAAGPAGPARDALLVTHPPAGQKLSTWTPSDADADADGAVANGEVLDGDANSALTDAALDDVFRQVLTLRAARIAHGTISTSTIVIDGDRCGLVDFQASGVAASPEQLDRDVAAAMAAAAVTVGPDRTVAAAVRVLPTDAIVAALPFLQRAALGPAVSRTLRGHKAELTALRETGARAVAVDVPKLIEPRRISWVSLALVVGTLVGGWALLGVLVNVGQSWSTITGADWAWVAVVFVLAQAAYPAIALTTLGSVTEAMPYGRTVALEVSNTFVGLAGGSVAVLGTRVRFFQQQGFDSTLAVSSGVLVSTVSWIVKGVLFLIALPLALSEFHFSEPASTGGGAGASTARLVELLIIGVVAVGIVLGIVLAVPRWRRLASAKLRPKASEVWGHLKVLAGHPRNLIEIFGGNAMAQVVVALALGAALHAFGQHLDVAALLIVLTLGSMLGGVSPVPGGMGVVEAGMIIGLTAAGIPESQAVAAVFVQRLFTAYLPPIWGWVTLMWMRRKEYL